jgi:hypothetical protein
VCQDGWQAAIFGGRSRPSLLMVAHQLARGSEVTSSWNGIHSVFSVPLVPFERANRSAGKKRNEFHSTTPRLRILGKGQNWLMVAHQLASAYQFCRKLSMSGPCAGSLAIRCDTQAHALPKPKDGTLRVWSSTR